jgi:amino acid transporter
MIKKKNYSVHYDFHTGILSRIFLIFTIIFFAIWGIILLAGFTGLNSELSESQIPGIIISIAIIFLFLGILLYFFHMQFIKLEKIADEIEELQMENENE